MNKPSSQQRKEKKLTLLQMWEKNDGTYSVVLVNK